MTISDTLRAMEAEEQIRKLEEQKEALEKQLEYWEGRSEQLEAALETAYYIIKDEAPRYISELRALEPIVRELFPR